MEEKGLEFIFPKSTSIIKVIGVGGGGNNAVNHMYNIGIQDVEYVLCNTDQQALQNSPVPFKIPLGEKLTGGRGAGNTPSVGENAAIESLNRIRSLLGDGTALVFITAGMGGGTGTGAAPVVAKLCKEQGILTIAVVTMPFHNEGRLRLEQAQEGLEELKQYVDSMLIVENQKLGQVFKDLPASQGFAKADDIVATAVKGASEIVTLPGKQNIDFADMRTVMKDSKVFIMGTGKSSGENRDLEAVNNTLRSPLLNNQSISGAQHILVNIISSSSHETTIDELGRIIDYLQNEAGSTANLIWGLRTDDTLKETIQVTVIATNFSNKATVQAYQQEEHKQYPKPQANPIIENNTVESSKQPEYSEPVEELSKIEAKEAKKVERVQPKKTVKETNKKKPGPLQKLKQRAEKIQEKLLFQFEDTDEKDN